MGGEPDFTNPHDAPRPPRSDNNNRASVSSSMDSADPKEGPSRQQSTTGGKPRQNKKKLVPHHAISVGGPKRTIPLPEWRYTMDAMNPNPTTRDPKCTEDDPELACLWPVYVGNFKANRDAKMAQLEEDVKRYFASRGLYVRFCYRPRDAYYAEFQSKAGLYDMLVYFVSERDADFAVEHLHRDSWCGYTINVFPGREPVYFDPDRSVRAENMKSGRTFSEHFFEKHVLRYGVVVECVVKFDMKNGAMEFATPEDAVRARRMERIWKYLRVEGQLQKQRFLEIDILRKHRSDFFRCSDELKHFRQDRYWEMLMEGRRPHVDPNRVYRVEPLRVGPSKRVMQRRAEKKKERLKKRGW